MENNTLNCKQCGARVRDEWRSKWNHVVKVHPEIVASHLLPLIENPLEAHRFGEALGGWLKSRII
jgi:hypothetical protein